jgi:peptide/nickel transport system ATP-binding protein
VLDTLRDLHQEFGISLIYITHDLTTAYQVSHKLVVLYSGSVAEVGAVEPVVKEPSHPYTQLLISSIPLPDPNHQWSDEPEPSAIGRRAQRGVGCKFAPRCPHAFAPCIEKAPPLYNISGQQAAACYLYQDRPVVPWDEMDYLLAADDRAVATP